MKLLTICLSSVLLFTYQNAAAQPNQIDQKALKQEAISLIKKFGGQLKPELKKALKSKGPVHAVEVCAKKAPEIARKINASSSNWHIKRVSLKNRNPNAKPDAWERKVLTMFDQKRLNGESAKKMAYSEVVDGKFRFMKAQATEAVCLTCHSKNIAPNIQKAIHQYYPNDKATGYSLGEIRGAFSLEYNPQGTLPNVRIIKKIPNFMKLNNRALSPVSP